MSYFQHSCSASVFCISFYVRIRTFLLPLIPYHVCSLPASLVFYFFSVQLGWDTVGLFSWTALSSCPLWGRLPPSSFLKTLRKSRRIAPRMDHHHHWVKCSFNESRSGAISSFFKLIPRFSVFFFQFPFFFPIHFFSIEIDIESITTGTLDPAKVCNVPSRKPIKAGLQANADSVISNSAHAQKPSNDNVTFSSKNAKTK